MKSLRHKADNHMFLRSARGVDQLLSAVYMPMMGT